MKHQYLLIILLFSLSCAENNSQNTEVDTSTPESRAGYFNPYRSKFYKPVFINIEHQQDKDTFLVGEDLTARISVNENIKMLKDLAANENLDYKIEYDVEAETIDKSTMVMSANDDMHANVKFKVYTSDSSKQFQEQKWRYYMKFIFLENNRNIYDTTLIRDAAYVVKLK